MNVVHAIMETKLELFGHIYRMDDNQLVKDMVFRIMDGQNMKGRPRRDWMDIKEWCQVGTHTLSITAQDRSE